jgi:hypothetical protein
VFAADANPPDDDDNLPLIIGCAVGGALCCILVVLLIVWLSRRTQTHKQREPSADQVTTAPTRSNIYGTAPTIYASSLSVGSEILYSSPEGKAVVYDAAMPTNVVYEAAMPIAPTATAYSSMTPKP